MDMNTSSSFLSNARRLRSWSRRGLALLLGVIVAPLAYALGFGEPELLSKLAQPLQVRVPIKLDNPSDIKGVQVKLADGEVYKAFRLSPPIEILRQARASVREENGQPYVYIESDQRNLEPYLALLLEAQIDGVRVVREVSVLSDPVEPKPQVQWYTPPAAQPESTDAGVQLSAQDAQLLQRLLKEERARQSAATAGTPAVALAPTPSIAPVPAQPEALGAFTEPTPSDRVATNSAPGTYGPIRPGQSISKIAQIVRTDPSINLPRMIAAMILANPQAFPNGPDSMLVGSVLTVPDMDNARSLRWNEVLRIVDQGPRSSAPASDESPVAEEPATVASETVATAVEQAPAPETAALQLVDQLETAAAVTGPVALNLQLVESMAEIPVAVAAAPPAVPADPMVDEDSTTTTAVIEPIAEATPVAATTEDSGTPYWLWAFAAALVFAGLAYGVDRLRKRKAAEAAEAMAAEADPEPEVSTEPSFDPATENNLEMPAAEPVPVQAPAIDPAATIRLVRPVLDAPSTNLQGRLAQLQRQAVDDAHKRKLSIAEAFLEGGETQDAKELMDEVEALMVLKSGDINRLRI